VDETVVASNVPLTPPATVAQAQRLATHRDAVLATLPHRLMPSTASTRVANGILAVERSVGTGYLELWPIHCHVSFEVRIHASYE
jgi:hypothetical protein